MKARLLILFSIFVITCSFSQEKKWNVEVNYTVIPEEGFGGDRNFLDTGIKYRFVKLGIFDVGFGVNGGFWTANIDNTGFENRRDKQYLIQPRFFTELQIPGLNKLRPSLGLGYSFVNTVSDFTFSNGNKGSNSSWDQGINLNLGLSYDITNRFFVQAQYDFIDLTVDNDIPEGVILLSSDTNFDINNLRIGLGFRF